MQKIPEEPNTLEGLMQLIRTLRSPAGCPWDRAQTDKDLAKYLLNEAYEVVEAVEEASPEHVREELGDLLFQILFIAVMAEERETYNLSEVLQEISAKMIRRHPHVFGDKPVSGVAEVKANWETIKTTVENKKKATGLLGGIPRALPALRQAQEMTKRASTVGFDWDNADQVLKKVEEEIGELRQAMQAGNPGAMEEEVGDVLFTIVNLARFINTDAEDALRGTISKFRKRFTYIEEGLRAVGKEPASATLAEMDRLWEEAKGKP